MIHQTTLRPYRMPYGGGTVDVVEATCSCGVSAVADTTLEAERALPGAHDDQTAIRDVLGRIRPPWPGERLPRAQGGASDGDEVRGRDRWSRPA